MKTAFYKTMVQLTGYCCLSLNTLFSQQLFTVDPTDTVSLQALSTTLKPACNTLVVYDPGVYAAELYTFRSFVLLGLLKNRPNFQVYEYEIHPTFLADLLTGDRVEEKIREYILYDASYDEHSVDASHAFYVYTLLHLFMEKRIIIHSRIGPSALGSSDFFTGYVKKRKADDTALCRSMDSLFYRDEITEAFISKWRQVRDRINEIKVDTLTYEGILFTCMVDYYDRFRSVEDLSSSSVFEDEINTRFNDMLNAIAPDPFKLFFNNPFSDVSSNDSTFNIFVSFNSGKITDRLLVCMKYKKVRFHGDKDLDRVFVRDERVEALWYTDPAGYRRRLYTYDIGCFNTEKEQVKPGQFQGLFIIDRIGRDKKAFYTWILR